MDAKIVYDSFNARYLTFQEVADSFISNNAFTELLENTHSLLMGPRGSGKTTLLKMLTPAALVYWDTKQKTDLFKSIPFYAIYIPTDIHWKRQLEQLNNDFGETEFVNNISRASVNINILISVIKTLSFLLENNQENKSEISSLEIEFSKTLIDHWRLDKPIAPTLYSIQLSLLAKIAKLNLEIRKKRSNVNYSIELEDFFYLDYFDLLQIAFSKFAQLFPSIVTKRWALCFDELEIAPKWLQNELLGYFRSREQNILFKLTTAPLVSIYDEIKEGMHILEASNRNDFKSIRVWTSNQKEFKNWYEFSNKLVRSRISRKYNRKTLPEEIFGSSLLDRVIENSFSHSENDDRSNFQENTATWYLIKELARIDDSFKSFLHKKKINPINPVPQNTKQRDEIFRKIKPIVTYRYQFKKEGPFKRSRKVVPLYYGINLIYEFCDGNPRILIGMIDDLLAMADGLSEFRSLSINEQSRLLLQVSTNYISVISSHPDANKTIQYKNYNLRNLLEKIGQYFHQRMVLEPFTMDPIGSFKVDVEINNKLIELLEVALYLGAIVYLDNPDDSGSTGIVGKRFRLSYTLSPYFSLLSREFPAVNLSTILGKDNIPSLF